MYLSQRGAKQVHYTSLFGWASFSTFVVLAALDSDGAIDAYWSLLLIPMYIAVTTIPVVIHLTMLHSGRQISPISMKLGIAFVYSMGTSLCINLLLLGLVSDCLDIPWSATFIPFWIGLGLFLALIVFLSPVMTKEPLNKKRELMLMVNYLLALILCSIFTATKLDKDNPEWWCTVLIPLWVAFALHFISFGFLERSDLEMLSPQSFPLSELLYLLLITSFTIFYGVKRDFGGIPGSVVAIPIGCLVALGVFNELKDFRRQQADAPL